MLDATAFALGIELVPCIQTLGHLSQVWISASDVVSLSDVSLFSLYTCYYHLRRNVFFPSHALPSMVAGAAVAAV
jgi:hypothetical protein